MRLQLGFSVQQMMWYGVVSGWEGASMADEEPQGSAGSCFRTASIFRKAKPMVQSHGTVCGQCFLAHSLSSKPLSRGNWARGGGSCLPLEMLSGSANLRSTEGKTRLKQFFSYKVLLFWSVCMLKVWRFLNLSTYPSPFCNCHM